MIADEIMREGDYRPTVSRLRQEESAHSGQPGHQPARVRCCIRDVALALLILADDALAEKRSGSMAGSKRSARAILSCKCRLPGPRTEFSIAVRMKLRRISRRLSCQRPRRHFT